MDKLFFSKPMKRLMILFTIIFCISGLTGCAEIQEAAESPSVYLPLGGAVLGSMTGAIVADVNGTDIGRGVGLGALYGAGLGAAAYLGIITYAVSQM